MEESKQLEKPQQIYIHCESMVFLQQSDDSVQDNKSLNCGCSSGAILVVLVVTRQSLCSHTGEVRQKKLTFGHRASSI